MNVFINDVHFTEIPSSCGSCPFFHCGATNICSGSDNGHCLLWNEMHHRWINVPRKCGKIFRKASAYNQREHLVIVAD